MPKGPNGQKRPADTIGAAVLVGLLQARFMMTLKSRQDGLKVGKLAVKRELLA